MQEDYVTWKFKSIPGKIRNKKNIENKKNIDAGVKFDARWDDKLKFFFKVPNPQFLKHALQLTENSTG